MNNKNINQIDDLEIEPLSDEALALAAGAGPSAAPGCCSCTQCSNDPGTPPEMITPF